MQLNLARLLVLPTLALALAGSDARAQDAEEEIQAAEIEELEPGVSSAILDEAAEGDNTAEAPTAVLAQDVRRREVSNGVMDEIELGRSEITGNQELPTVLYIVPWQKSDPGDLMGKPVNTLLDEVLAPIDRSEFIRQVDYYGDLYGEKEEQDQ
jgi:hypothetical protein